VGNRCIVEVLKLGKKIEPRMLRYSADGKSILAPLDGGPVTIWDSERFCKLDEFSGTLHDGVFGLDQETRERWLASFATTNENSKKFLAELLSGSKPAKGAAGAVGMIRAQRPAASSYTFSPWRLRSHPLALRPISWAPRLFSLTQTVGTLPSSRGRFSI
jgi:hypothetical protein